MAIDIHEGELTKAGWQKKYKGDGQTFALTIETNDKPKSYYLGRDEDEALRQKATAMIGQYVGIQREGPNDAGYYNVLDIFPAQPQATESKSGPSNGEDMSKDEWRYKDDLDKCTRIVNTIISNTGALDQDLAFAAWGCVQKMASGQTPAQQSAQSVDESTSELPLEGPDLFDDSWIEEANWTPEGVRAELTKTLMNKKTGLGWAGGYVKNMLTEKFGYGSVDEMPQEMLEEVVIWARAQKAT